MTTWERDHRKGFAVPSGSSSSRVRVRRYIRAARSSSASSPSQLLESLSNATGVNRWITAAELARLGISDDVILRRIKRSALPALCVEFNQSKFCALYAETSKAVDNKEKGKSLEDLAEYAFSSIPGLVLRSRNLRGEADEIDLAFSNQAEGFWGHLDDPFIVECKNVKSPIEALVIRDLAGKLDAKRIRSAFLLTTSTFTRGSQQVFRDLRADGKLIVPVATNDLQRIATGCHPDRVFSDRFYALRLS